MVISGINKSLDQGDGMSPAVLPVRGELPEHQFHKPADQIGRVIAGKNQQPGVIGQKREATTTLFGRPSDGLIAIFDVESCRTPSGHCQPLPLVNESVAQMLAHQRRVVEIMMLDNRLIATGDLLGLGQ